MSLKSILRRLAPALFLATLPATIAGGSALARCSGANLIADLAPADSQALEEATRAHPFSSGNLWRATKGEQSVLLVGTYHLSDDRHATLTARVAGMMEGATALLVEAGPDEEAALKRDLAADPGLLFLTDGPSLMQQFPPEEWAQMTQALAARKVPAIMGAKMQPWYLASILAIPPCDMPEVTAGLGLDHRVMELAKERDIPIRALEPYTTVFRIFDSMSAEEQLAMLRSSLMMEDRVADFSVTLSDAYFQGESRMVWEFLRQLSGQLPGYTPERADAEFAQMEAVLMTERNQSWIPVIEEAAAHGPIVAAFGALHLAGETGVLNLLAENGWQLEQLDG
jgi:uncharacterized protein YbaP (TraB family)